MKLTFGILRLPWLSRRRANEGRMANLLAARWVGRDLAGPLSERKKEVSKYVDPFYCAKCGTEIPYPVFCDECLEEIEAMKRQNRRFWEWHEGRAGSMDDPWRRKLEDEA